MLSKLQKWRTGSWSVAQVVAINSMGILSMKSILILVMVGRSAINHGLLKIAPFREDVKMMEKPRKVCLKIINRGLMVLACDSCT